MTGYKINIKRSAEKEFESLPDKIYDKVINRLLLLRNNPRPQGVKKLRCENGYRIRVGDYRILYDIDDENNLLEIYSIAHRREVYR
ncbi:MAG: type II toxin-antitoxin system RelE/ParE family toxin [Chlorobaculum sp.]|jgi:mRNA interferase RelE/StbE|nr:type II toxin-antitoxin system RelE/ParE family toxin [Chlorobaculum sp.]